MTELTPLTPWTITDGDLEDYVVCLCGSRTWQDLRCYDCGYEVDSSIVYIANYQRAIRKGLLPSP